MGKIIKINDDYIKKLNKFTTQEFVDIHGALGDELSQIILYAAKNRNFEFNYALFDHVIVKCVTLLESYFKNIAIGLIDKFNYDVSDVKITTTFDELKTIQKNSDITLGKIVVHDMNFQKLENISYFFDMLLKIRFFKELENNGIDWDIINDAVQIRHSIVHEGKHIHEIKNLKVNDPALFKLMKDYVIQTILLTKESMIIFMKQLSLRSKTPN